jgi:hypothetical protein
MVKVELKAASGKEDGAVTAVLRFEHPAAKLIRQSSTRKAYLIFFGIFNLIPLFFYLTLY